MAYTIYSKDPNAVLDYQINWATWLGADTIATSTWTADTGITVASETETTTTTTVWLSGGTAGQQYNVTNRIVTNAGRTEDRTIIVKVEHSSPADSVRDGMTTLITRWRRYVNDAAGSVWTDREVQEILDGYRTDFWDREMVYVPQYIAGTTTYKIYQIGDGNLEEAASGTDAWRVIDTGGTTIGTALYTVDYLRGLVTFTANQMGSVRYVDGRSYDLHGAAAHGWRELAGIKASLYKFTADGATYDRQQWYEHCMEMASYHDSLATSGSGGLSVGQMVRSDVAVW